VTYTKCSITDASIPEHVPLLPLYVARLKECGNKSQIAAWITVPSAPRNTTSASLPNSRIICRHAPQGGIGNELPWRSVALIAIAVSWKAGPSARTAAEIALRSAQLPTLKEPLSTLHPD
jgi:hypothetical protein